MSCPGIYQNYHQKSTQDYARHVSIAPKNGPHFVTTVLLAAGRGRGNLAMSMPAFPKLLTHFQIKEDVVGLPRLSNVKKALFKVELTPRIL